MHNIKSPRRLVELAVEVDVLDHQQDLQIINIHCNGLDDAEGFRAGAGGFRFDVVGGGDGWGRPRHYLSQVQLEIQAQHSMLWHIFILCSVFRKCSVSYEHIQFK